MTAVIRKPAAYWQIALEAFSEAKEPMSWHLPGVKLSRAQKYEAVMYLVEVGLVGYAGRRCREDNHTTYLITPGGRYTFDIIKGTLRGRVGKMSHSATTVGQRAVATNPVSVFDLARASWVWDRAAERRAEAAEEERRGALAAVGEEL